MTAFMPAGAAAGSGYRAGASDGAPTVLATEAAIASCAAVGLLGAGRVAHSAATLPRANPKAICKPHVSCQRLTCVRLKDPLTAQSCFRIRDDAMVFDTCACADAAQTGFNSVHDQPRVHRPACPT
jgi:hypothetical protein